MVRVRNATQRIGSEADLDRALSAQEAASFLGVSPKTLQAWRRLGKGPRYTRMSRTVIVYRMRRLLEYLEASEVQSTSEATSMLDAPLSEGESKNLPPAAAASSRA